MMLPEGQDVAYNGKNQLCPDHLDAVGHRVEYVEVKSYPVRYMR
jgi:hypothetical protein